MPFKAGQYYQICDVCGFKLLSNETKLRWDGLIVCPADYETDHPQKFIRGVSDGLAVEAPRPQSTDVFTDVTYMTYTAPSTTFPALPPAPPPPPPPPPEAKGRLTFDSAAQGTVSVTGGTEYVAGPGQVVGTLRTIKELYSPGTIYTSSSLLGTVLYVGGGNVEATFNEGFTKFSLAYAAFNTDVQLQFYNDLGVAVGSATATLPRTTITPDTDTYREWHLTQVSLPDISPRKFTKVTITGTGGQYAVDNITFGSLIPIGTL